MRLDAVRRNCSLREGSSRTMGSFMSSEWANGLTRDGASGSVISMVGASFGGRVHYFHFRHYGRCTVGERRDVRLPPCSVSTNASRYMSSRTSRFPVVKHEVDESVWTETRYMYLPWRASATKPFPSTNAGCKSG